MMEIRLILSGRLGYGDCDDKAVSLCTAAELVTFGCDSSEKMNCSIDSLLGASVWHRVIT